MLSIGGEVARPALFSLADIRARPAITTAVTLECAGNGRSFLQPRVPGEQWTLGAVGTAEWTGVPLAELLAEVEPGPDATEIRFAGADRGTPEALGHEIAFERSLSIAEAGSALVAYAMNGEPLPPNHGAPLRLLVPGHYGMASVKWLATVTVTSEPFRGFFQVDRYVAEGQPLGPIAPRAVIASPAPGASLAAGEVVVRGYAWSGFGPIARVEVSVDGGATWAPAELPPAVSSGGWSPWRWSWRAATPGRAVLLARATDSLGNRQPLEQVWNELGYGNNAAQPVEVEVLPG